MAYHCRAAQQIEVAVLRRIASRFTAPAKSLRALRRPLVCPCTPRTPIGRATDAVPSCDQPDDRQGTRPHDSAIAPATRRWGNPVAAAMSAYQNRLRLQRVVVRPPLAPQLDIESCAQKAPLLILVSRRGQSVRRYASLRQPYLAQEYAPPRIGVQAAE